VFTCAYAQSFMVADPIVEIINSEPDQDKREALTIAYQWADHREELWDGDHYGIFAGISGLGRSNRSEGHLDR
jgi:hypothetical protein